jgi:hypothetical protein
MRRGGNWNFEGTGVLHADRATPRAAAHPAELRGVKATVVERSMQRAPVFVLLIDDGD